MSTIMSTGLTSHCPAFQVPIFSTIDTTYYSAYYSALCATYISAFSAANITANDTTL
jgi:hypothetical protein